MASKRKYFDVAVGESDGNGGDIQLLGNDLAIVYGNENQTYLALFGGNVEENTASVQPGKERFDWWGNTLLFGNQQARQYNSNFERTLNQVPLNSEGRVKLENAAKDDLKYLSAIGATVTVECSIIDVNVVELNIKTVYSSGSGKITVITFGKRTTNGDFSTLDFNEDFF